MNRRLVLLACLLLSLAVPAAAHDRYPSHVVRLVVPSAIGGSTDVLARAQAQQPGFLSYASNGAGTADHPARALLKTAAAIDLSHVMYKGSGPALNDLLGGPVAMTMD